MPLIDVLKNKINDNTNGVLSWTCGHNADVRDQIPVSYLPTSCQGASPAPDTSL